MDIQSVPDASAAKPGSSSGRANSASQDIVLPPNCDPRSTQIVIGGPSTPLPPSFAESVTNHILSGSFLWVVLLATALVAWRSHVGRLLQAFVERIEDGGEVSVGPIVMKEKMYVDDTESEIYVQQILDPVDIEKPSYVARTHSGIKME